MPRFQYLTAAEVDAHLERDNDKHGTGIVVSNSECDACSEHGWVIIVVFRSPVPPHTAYQRICASCLLDIAVQVGTRTPLKGDR